MKWFRKVQQEISSPPILATRPTVGNDDERALTKIMNMCDVVTADAESLSQSKYNGLAKRERQRFESAKRMSLELAKKMTGVLDRDRALSRIVELCIKANDIDTARVLVRGIQTSTVRDRLIEDHPVIFY